ncbi:restriction endonuclease PLD domain-containing protein [Chryseolinea sp. H1M3-3]|uniref:restriction endonuclease PLD domain-containing protein n=1 Tax=Chryseolinea sp. H1M3-3 TaxID=3034144 RepID=UPI0023EBF40B|nr:restriction endonuclease PLD domain-containing protein [Chryseolinea sp. H1M3-3]
MITKKLAVPFINEKLLQQVEHCYIATAAISEAGFDFIRTRIPTKTKMEIVTGLEMPTSPGVLQRIWRNYQGRITLNIYTRNDFHANVYIFDLPYRKSVAFVGSGHFTLEGIKDSEELFYKISDAKEIENLKSWFIGYYEFAQPLTETLIAEYELRYPVMKQRHHASRLEKKQFIALTTAGFSWDQMKLKQQYFKKEDYLAFSSSKAHFTTPELYAERVSVQNKFKALHELIKNDLQKLGFHATDPNSTVSSFDPAHHDDSQLRSMWLAYSIKTALKNRDEATTFGDQMHVQIMLSQMDMGIYFLAGSPRKGRVDREYFKRRMNDVEYRKQTFALLSGLGGGYWIEVACERKNIDAFPTEDALWEFTKADQWLYYDFIIGKNYTPDAVEISSENIAATIVKELDKLSFLFRHMQAAAEM